MWLDGIVYEVSGQNLGGISSGGKHFQTRSECLDVLQQMTSGNASNGVHRLPWATGYQKVLDLSVWDLRF